jgi:hypothetical protein
MPLQRFTIGCMLNLAKIVRGTIAMLRFFGVVHGTTTPLAPCGLGANDHATSHSSEKGILPTTFLISK